MNSLFYARLLRTASFLGAMGVIVGAFGAHFLKSRLAASDLEVLRTGVLYLFIHVLIIMVIVILSRNDFNSRALRGAGILFASGIILFSGSLFFIATQSLSGLNLASIGIVTPIGGLCFIMGWIMLFIYSFSHI